MTTPAHTLQVGDVILPPARELQLWMRRHCREHGLSEDALRLTITDIREGQPDKRGRWLVFVTAQDPAWKAAGMPFRFKARPETPWPLLFRPPGPFEWDARGREIDTATQA